jgi:hypothetical protein
MPLKNVARTTIIEPALYCLCLDECVSRCRFNDLAEEAWACFQQALPDCSYSEAFADGFKAGFADYLYAGGNGEPPLVPPRPYWKPNYESPEGHQMMQDWFRGYRHGAAVARDSGYRETVVIPASASLPRFKLPEPSNVRVKPMPPADEPLPEPKQLPPPKELPQPKPAPQAKALPAPAVSRPAADTVGSSGVVVPPPPGLPPAALPPAPLPPAAPAPLPLPPAPPPALRGN